MRIIGSRGLFAQDLQGGIEEMQYIAKGTKTNKGLYHGEINPDPTDSNLTPEQFTKALEIYESELGLSGQPCIVVMHEKKGRQHYHIVHSRIDQEKMQAISDSWNFVKHERAARTMERELDLTPQRGCLFERDGERQERRPTQKQMQAGKQHGEDSNDLQAFIRQTYRDAGNAQDFLDTIEKAGFHFCKGDRRDFVFLSPEGAPITQRALGLRVADLREYFKDIDRDSLATAAETKAAIAREKEQAKKRREREAEEAAALRIEDAQEPDPRQAAQAFKMQAEKIKLQRATARAAYAPQLTPDTTGDSAAAALAYLRTKKAAAERKDKEPRPMHPDDHKPHGEALEAADKKERDDRESQQAKQREEQAEKVRRKAALERMAAEAKKRMREMGGRER